jgi:Leucine-rich repeat (LRR) protein
MKLLDEAFGGPKQMKFSEMAERNTYNKICSLKNMGISSLDRVNPGWMILNMDLSGNKLTKFPVELNQLKTLQVLKLDENMIPEVTSKDLLSFPSLSQLDIRSNNMKRFCADFNELPVMEKVKVYHSHIKVMC